MEKKRKYPPVFISWYGKGEWVVGFFLVSGQKQLSGKFRAAPGWPSMDLYSVEYRAYGVLGGIIGRYR